MFDQVIFLLVGLTLLLVSVDRMIEYSDRIAKYFQISPILIGLTLVAFGTSAPELVITLFASFNNPPNTDAIIGNVIGSNIANILLILGFSGLFFKLDFGKIIFLSTLCTTAVFAQDVPDVPVEPEMFKGDIAWMMTATLLVTFMAVPGLALFYGGLVRTKNMLSMLMQ